MKSKIIVIDDELDFLDTIRRGLITAGYRNLILEADAMAVARQLKSGERYDAALIDITMPGMSGVELLETFKEFSPQTECIMVTALDEARVAVECMRKGAYDFLVKPISKEDLVSSLTRALEHKRLVEILDICKKPKAPKLTHPEAFADIITNDVTMLKILKEAELYATSDVPVLIRGEAGTGKKLLARSIHQASTRCNRRYIPVSMENTDRDRLAAHLFGHVKNAQQNIDKDHIGYLEESHRGTLFIQEIEKLPLELQEGVLMVLKNGEMVKMGGNRPQRVDLRLITATKVNLENQIARNRFRNDLYHRLRGGWIYLPPLRHRKKDITRLVEHFLQSSKPHSMKMGITPEALSLLHNYSWPGNVGELKATVNSAIDSSQGKPIAPDHLPDHLVN